MSASKTVSILEFQCILSWQLRWMLTPTPQGPGTFDDLGNAAGAEAEGGGWRTSGAGETPGWCPNHSSGDNPCPAGASSQLDPLTQSGDKLFHVSIFHLKCKLDLTE